jgi:hypothetical protein
MSISMHRGNFSHWFVFKILNLVHNHIEGKITQILLANEEGIFS